MNSDVKVWTPVDRHVIDLDAALGEQLLDVALGQAVAQVPAHRNRDHLTWEPATRRCGRGRSRRARPRIDHPISLLTRGAAQPTQQTPFNLTRAVGALASTIHAKATTATIRAQLINVAARITRSARRATLRLPALWPWATAWQRLFTAATGPPGTA